MQCCHLPYGLDPDLSPARWNQRDRHLGPRGVVVAQVVVPEERREVLSIRLIGHDLPLPTGLLAKPLVLPKKMTGQQLDVLRCVLQFVPPTQRVLTEVPVSGCPSADLA